MYPSPQILLDVSKEVERIEAEEAAARAAEEAEALAMAEAEAAGEEYVPAAAAPVTAAAPAYTPAPKAAVGEEARVIDAISRSPLMLTLPSGAKGLSQLVVLDDAMIVASCVLLMRVEGMFDAKEMIREDCSVSDPVIQRGSEGMVGLVMREAVEVGVGLAGLRLTRLTGWWLRMLAWYSEP